MSPAEVFRRYTQAVDGGDVEDLAQWLHGDFRLEGAGLDGIGKGAFVEAMRAQLEAFPDYSENPSKIRERQDAVEFLAHVTGTQKGVFRLPGKSPIAPTGRKIALPAEPCRVVVRDDLLIMYHVTAVPGGGVEGILAQITEGAK